MLKPTLFAAALIGAASALAQTPEPVTPVNADTGTGWAPASPVSYQGRPENMPREARIPNMVDYLEAVVDDRRGVFIRGYTGQWYYARVQGACPRLQRGARLRFNPSPGGDFDRYSTIRADGWRCMLSSVVESGAPPRRRSRHS